MVFCYTINMEWIENIYKVFGNIPAILQNWDILLVLILTGGSILYMIFLGKRRIVLVSLATYMALAVLAYTPTVGRLKDVWSSMPKAVLFICLFLFLFFLLSRIALERVFAGGGYVGGWWQALLLAFFQIGLLCSIFLSFLPAEYLSNFSQLTRTVLFSDWGRLAWLAMPILLMAALADNRHLYH